MRHLKQSPAMVVACVALLAALTGTGVAAVTALPRGSVHTAALANGAVTTSKLANKAVTLGKLAASARISGPKGPKGDPGRAGVTNVWTGYAYPTAPASVYSSAGAELAHLTFTSPAAGFAVLTANFATRIHQATATDCRVQTQIAPAAGVPDETAPGFVDQWINGNLPTQFNGGTYLGLNASATRVLPIVSGSNTVYLNGKSDCTAVLLGPVTLTAVLAQNNPSSTLTTP
jgi:hypothetical protein